MLRLSTILNNKATLHFRFSQKKRSYYDILGISGNVSQRELKKKYLLKGNQGHNQLESTTPTTTNSLAPFKSSNSSNRPTKSSKTLRKRWCMILEWQKHPKRSLLFTTMRSSRGKSTMKTSGMATRSPAITTSEMNTTKLKPISLPRVPKDILRASQSLQIHDFLCLCCARPVWLRLHVKDIN